MSKQFYFEQFSLTLELFYCKNEIISDNSVKHKYAVYTSKQFYFEQFSLA